MVSIIFTGFWPFGLHIFLCNIHKIKITFKCWASICRPRKQYFSALSTLVYGEERRKQFIINVQHCQKIKKS